MGAYFSKKVKIVENLGGGDGDDGDDGDDGSEKWEEAPNEISESESITQNGRRLA